MWFASGHELEAVFKAYAASRSDASRDEWERMRMLATISIQPHVSKKVTPQRLLPLPWDSERKTAGTRPTAETMSPEERMKKFDRLVRLNLGKDKHNQNI